MGLLDTIRTVLGVRAEADAARDAAPDDLWGMSTAYVTMEADLDFAPAGVAALTFGDVDSTDFADTVSEVEAILRAGEAETGTAFRRHVDDRGYRWVVFEDTDPEDLVTSVHFAADTFVERGYGSRLLAAVFAFERIDSAGGSADDTDRVYWIYSFRRGAYYPFAPTADRERDQRLEFKLSAVLDAEMDVEDDEAYWYPLWPGTPGAYPWE